MTITNVIEGQRRLTDREVRDIIRKNSALFTHIDRNLSQILPSLVEYVVGLAKERKQTHILSEFYPLELPTRDGKRTMNYEVSYEADENCILILAFDPSSDAMDPRESYIKQIRTQEFLAWAMGDKLRMIDVYQHIQAALRQKKGNGEAPRRNFEPYF